MKQYKLIYDVLHPHKLNSNEYDILKDKVVYFEGLYVKEYFYIIDLFNCRDMIFAHCLYRNILGEMTATIMYFDPEHITYYDGHIAEADDETAKPVKYVETEITVHSYESI